ncbi:MAG: hypothetical protein GKR88_21040 [Flavobacteriaceae bacterium]|nr:MAG: hypothetical protein GKR88_18935 [Flavobacteriaceae bacterium]QMU66527.1 MAG: hypothetical protein GKR88_21040 [Flavobacteriaceae bacterium]
MKKLFLSTLTTLLTLCVQSQDLPRIVPPSPEASALANFIEVPVSHYTGLPNISVPIYTIKEGSMEIPIQLSYHARGVQVSEVAPRTGTGWSLQYGGSISRQMRGKSDESIKGYLARGHYFVNYPQDLQTRQAVHNSDNELTVDFYPDQFTFNAGGVSGKFVLDYTDGQPLIQSFGDITIGYTRENGWSGKIDAFVMTDANGNKYYFGVSKNGLRKARDYQHSTGYTIDYWGNQVLDPPADDSDEFYSAWKLMDIETVTGDIISFFYENQGGVYWGKSGDFHINPNPEGSTTGIVGMGDLEQIRTKISRIQNYEYQISRIEFNNGRDKIEFISEATGREDFVGHALDKIEIYQDDQLVKGYDLAYEYTESTDTTNMLPGLSYLAMYFKRLFLKEISEYGSDNSYLPPYRFTYDEEVLPSVLSSRQDYWGYYNGAKNNGPFTRIFHYGLYIPDRRVDTLKSEAGILKEIKYPTGGKAKFTYEHNRGRSVPWSDLVKLPAINPRSSDPNFQGLGFLHADAYDGDRYIGDTFTVNPDPNGILASFSVTLPIDYLGTDQNVACADPLEDCMFIMKLEGLNGAPTYYLYAGDTDFYIQPGEYRLVFDPVRDIEWETDPGNWDFNQGGELNPFPYIFNIQVSWQQQSDLPLLFGPGKRIKKIEHMDVNGVLSVKEYEYVYPTDDFSQEPTNPSGSIKGLPAFLNKPIEGYDGDFYGFTTPYTSYYDSGSAFSSFQSNYIGYSGVVEYQGTKNNNIGKTEYGFTNFNDSGGDYFEFPYHPPTDNEWLRGKPVGVYYYKNDGNRTDGSIEYKLVKQVHNKYRYGDRLYTPDFVIPFGSIGGLQFSDDIPQDEQFIFMPRGEEFEWSTNSDWNYQKTRTSFRLPLFMLKRYAQGNSANNNPNYHNAYRMYDLTGGTLHLDSTTERIYNDTGIVENTTTYRYDYDKHYQQKGSSMTDSRGDVVETTNYYPSDVLGYSDLGYDDLTRSQVNAIVKMRAPDVNNPDRTHQLATPVQVETRKNGSVVSVVRTNYNIEDTGLVLPQSVATLKGIYDADTNPLEDRIIYHKYDSKGNPVEVSKKDGGRIYYVWGYDKTYPIAKIKGIHALLPTDLSAKFVLPGSNKMLSVVQYTPL